MVGFRARVRVSGYSKHYVKYMSSLRYKNKCVCVCVSWDQLITESVLWVGTCDEFGWHAALILLWATVWSLAFGKQELSHSHTHAHTHTPWEFKQKEGEKRQRQEWENGGFQYLFSNFEKAWESFVMRKTTTGSRFFSAFTHEKISTAGFLDADASPCICYTQFFCVKFDAPVCRSNVL